MCAVMQVIFDPLSGDTAAAAAGRKKKGKGGPGNKSKSSRKVAAADVIAVGISNQPVIEIKQEPWDPAAPQLAHKGGLEY